MKRFLSIIFLIVLVLAVTSVTFAAGTIGVDFVPGGIDYIKEDSEHQIGKLTSSYITLEGTLDDFKYGIEYGSGESKFKDGDIFLSDCTYDFYLLDYKFGVRFLNLERIKMDAVFSNTQLRLKAPRNKIDENAYMVGCDFGVIIVRKVTLDGYLGYSLFGATYEENGRDYDPAFLSAAKLKVNYLVSEKFALSLGYRTILCYVDDYDNNSIDDLWRGISSYSVGFKYSF